MNNAQNIQIDNQETEKLIALAMKFKAQQKGKRPEFIQRYVNQKVSQMKDPSFSELLYQLELDAIKRDREGERASPIEKIDRVWEVLTYHDKKRRIQICFSTLKNKFYRTKKYVKPK